MQADHGLYQAQRQTKLPLDGRGDKLPGRCYKNKMLRRITVHLIKVHPLTPPTNNREMRTCLPEKFVRLMDNKQYKIVLNVLTYLWHIQLRLLTFDQPIQKYS